MNRTIQTLNGASALLGLVGAFCFTGCAPVDEGDDPQVDETQQAQVNPDVKVWLELSMRMTDPSRTPLATMYVFNQALGSYQTRTEYWYVNLDSMSLLGLYDIEVTSTAQDTTTAPNGSKDDSNVPRAVMAYASPGVNMVMAVGA